MENVQYTLVVTSCGRHDLLNRTLKSFVKYADILPVATVIIEDGDKHIDLTLSELEMSALGQLTIVTNGRRKGQIYSVDRAYAEIQTEYVFHCEDDWEFKKSGFVEKSLEILENHKGILSVSLRTDWQHPIVKSEKYPFDIIQPDWDGGWGGFSFNPGMRRMSDYRKIGSYGKHVGYNPFEVGELYLSQLYHSLGFSIASLEANPYVEHIGWGARHVEWKTAPKPLKVLIAIPMCWKYEYKDQGDGRVHKDGITDNRINAIRSTWEKDLAAFKSYVDFKFFYGRDEHGLDKTAWSREPLSDEVFLNVPDDYKSLPLKVQAIYKWALDNGFDYVFKADDDTFIYVDRLLATDYDKYDYLGYAPEVPGISDERKYASGGSGYWLSRRAMQFVVNSKPEIGDWAEDAWVGKVLYKSGIKVVRDARYLPGFWEHFTDIEALPKDHSYITMHACTAKMMQDLHSKILSPNFTPVVRALHEDNTAGNPDDRLAFEALINECSIESTTDNEFKRKANKSIERLVRLVLKERSRIDLLEQRLDRFNQKSSHKI